jgi:hypothetical protein
MKVCTDGENRWSSYNWCSSTNICDKDHSVRTIATIKTAPFSHQNMNAQVPWSIVSNKYSCMNQFVSCCSWFSVVHRRTSMGERRLIKAIRHAWAFRSNLGDPTYGVLGRVWLLSVISGPKFAPSSRPSLRKLNALRMCQAASNQIPFMGAQWYQGVKLDSFYWRIGE